MFGQGFSPPWELLQGRQTLVWVRRAQRGQRGRRGRRVEEV